MATTHRPASALTLMQAIAPAGRYLMIRKIAAVIGVVVIAVAAQGADVGQPAKTVVEKRFAAVRRHDIEAIVALYAPDAVETSPGLLS